MADTLSALLTEATDVNTAPERLAVLSQINQDLARTVASNPGIDPDLLWSLAEEYPLTIAGNPRFHELIQSSPTWWQTAPLNGLIALLAIANPDIPEAARENLRERFRIDIPANPEIQIALSCSDFSLDPLEVELENGDVLECQLATSLVGITREGVLPLDFIPEDPCDLAALIVILKALLDETFSFPIPTFQGVIHDGRLLYEDIAPVLEELTGTHDDELELNGDWAELVIEHISSDCTDLSITPLSHDLICISVRDDDINEEIEIDLERQNEGCRQSQIRHSETELNWPFPDFQIRIRERQDNQSDAELLFSALTGIRQASSLPLVGIQRFRTVIKDDGTLSFDQALIKYIDLDTNLDVTPNHRLIYLSAASETDDEDEYIEPEGIDSLTLSILTGQDLVLEHDLIVGCGFQPSEDVTVVFDRRGIYIFPTSNSHTLGWDDDISDEED